MTLLKQKQHLWFLGLFFFLSLNILNANSNTAKIKMASPIDSSEQSITVLPKQTNPLSISRVKPSFQGGTSCENAALICQSTTSFTGSIVPNPITDASKYSEFCFRNDINNPVWYAFIAGAAEIEFDITSGFCSEGVQAAIVQSDDCSKFSLTNGLCCAGFESCVNKIDPNMSKKLDAFGLIIGKTYYLVIDGYGTNDGILGSCSFTVELKSPPTSILNSNAASVQVSGPSAICPNQPNQKFKVSPTSVAQNYKWTADNGVTITGSSTDTIVSVNWGASQAKVCVEVATTCAVASLPACKTVNIGQAAITSIDTVLCQGSSIKIGNQTFSTTGDFTVDFPNGSITGCDSTVKLKLTILNVGLNPINKSGDLSCSNPSVTLTGGPLSLSPNNASPPTYEWRNSANAIIGNNNSVVVTQQGTYSLVVKATLNGVTCESNRETITVNQTGNVPARPVLDGQRSPCVNRNETYTIINPAADVTQYNWTVTGGFIQNPTTAPSVSATWTGIGAGKMCVTAQNSCGVSESACLDIVINSVPPALPITGEQFICPNNTKTYFVTPNANVTSYQWTVPSGASISSGQGESLIIVNWGSSTGGQITMTPSNGCGAGQSSNLTVSINTTKPTALDIQGPKAVCPRETAKYFVATDPSVIEYRWILPSGVTALTPLNQATIDVRFDANAPAKLTLEIKNGCQLTTQMSLDVNIKTILPDEPIITGPSSVCSNDNTNFNIPNNPAITKYTWAVPSGATILSGQGSFSIQVNWGSATSGQVSLEVENACGLKNKGFLNVTIKDATLQAPTISGGASVCPSAKAVYAVPANNRIISYNWTTTSDATIVPTTNPNEFSLEWKNTGGDVCLEIRNDCGVTQKTCIPVEVKSALDSLPITGDATVCEGKIATFTVQKDAGASSYNWTLPTGAVIQTGVNTNQITALFGTVDGVVRVVPVGGCASGRPSTVNVVVKKKPNAPLSILGKTAACVGDIEKYSVPTQADAVLFKWTIPTGGVITDGINTREITVEWRSASSGNISVSGMGECGESTIKTLAVSVKDLPKPDAGFDENVCGLTYKMKASNPINTLTWSVFGKPNPTASVVFANANLANTDITVSELGNYTFVLSENNGNCTTTDTLKLSFKSKPTLTLIDETCDLEATQYAVRVKLNGRAPYSFRGSLVGSIVQDTFKSQPIASGSEYKFVIIDAFGCASDTLKGRKTCSCATSAGTLKQDSLVLCFGTKGKVIHQANAVLDRDDTFDFILHKGTPTSLGAVISKNKTGEFAFDSLKMQHNTVYYIHYAIGSNVRGEANQTDKCFAISNGVPIVFKERLTANLSGDTTVCLGTPASLIFKANANDIFRVSYQTGNEIFEISSIRNLDKFSVSPSLSSVYRLVEVVNRSGCKAEVSGTTNVNVRPRPTLNAGADQTVCDRTTTLNATIPPQYLGTWRSQNASKVVAINSPNSLVENLQNGRNSFILTIQDSICLTYRVSDTVSVFLPIIPKGNSLALEVFAGDSIKANVTESAPIGTYNVTALNSPASGRFAIFSDGGFTYISDSTFKGVVKFRYLICSQNCMMVCDTGEVRILVKEKIKPPVDTTTDVDIPNAITPNGDGKNDFFVIDNIEKFTKSELTVFNRWGEILYRSKAYNGQWGGTNQNGEPLAEGTYYYILRLNVDDGKILRGDVTILR
jgi:gliding motility-associated-like protein